MPTATDYRERSRRSREAAEIATDPEIKRAFAAHAQEFAQLGELVALSGRKASGEDPKILETNIKDYKALLSTELDAAARERVFCLLAETEAESRRVRIEAPPRRPR